MPGPNLSLFPVDSPATITDSINEDIPDSSALDVSSANISSPENCHHYCPLIPVLLVLNKQILTI